MGVNWAIVSKQNQHHASLLEQKINIVSLL